MTIAENAIRILERMAESARRGGRTSEAVQLVAVSKKQSVEKMREYLVFCRERHIAPVFGENYVQEFREKRALLEGDYSVHLIGPLQRNKAKDAVALFDVIESIHSREVLDAVALAAGKAGKVQRVFLQVNISGDPAKSGFLPEEVSAVRVYATTRPELRVEGLMTITRLYDAPEEARGDFRRMREIRDGLSNNETTLELSMGMSDDFEVAIEEGATIVRVGSALFGSRS